MNRYYTQQQPTSYQPLIIVVILLAIGVQYINGGWPFVPRDIPPGPVAPIDDDDDGDNEIVSPSGKVAWLTVIEESESRPVSRQIVLDDLEAYRPEWVSKYGVRYQLYDDDLEEAKNFIYRAKSEGVQVPFAMTTDSSGNMLEVKPMPDSSRVLREMVEK